ncbi:MAG: lipid-A-disaccharide synthase [Candidatus Eisenbacteria bacterium]|nr:lipid-A-disaccharide synthase [Candidatus Eisenbacteria bacterium]
MHTPRILLVAGEASGDAHGAGLVAALRARAPALRFCGVGGPRMEAAGVELLGRSEALAVVGLVEVLGHLPRVMRLFRRLTRRLRRDPPDLFVPIDAPDFNLRLAARAVRRGVPVVYFVAPQMWAWRPERAEQMRRRARELLVLFPFEEDWFRSRGVPVTYVGHPLVDAARARIEGDAPAGGAAEGGLLLPGSRRSEVTRHLPALFGAVDRLQTRFPELPWTLRLADGLEDSFYRRWRWPRSVRASREPIFDLAARSRVAICASGTASFEVALMGTPMVVVYRVSPLTWQLARRLVRVPWVSMANLAAGEAIVPELIQSRCAPQPIAAEVRALLDDPARAQMMRGKLTRLREAFGPAGAYGRAAERVLAHLPDLGASPEAC